MCGLLCTCIVADSWGYPQSGYLLGDGVWEGSYEGCTRVADHTSNITGQHCLVTWMGVMVGHLHIIDCKMDILLLTTL